MSTATAAAPARNSASNSAGAKAAAEYKEALAVSSIVPDPENRKDHDKDALQRLADQIKEEGLLQPILVRPMGGSHSGMYKIIAGERRWLAHKINGAKTIRAFVHLSESEASAATKQVIENLGREDLDPIEEAKQLQRLVNLGKTQAEVGKLVRNKSQSAVANTVKLLQLPAAVQKMISARTLSAAHGQELVRFAAWPKACEYMAAQVVKNNSNENEEFLPAKWLRDKSLPFENGLTRAKLAVEIYTGDYEYGNKRKYTIPESLTEAQGFFRDTGYSSAHYLLPADPKAPNLWEPEREKQDKARAEKAKQKDKTEERSQSKMTPAQKAERDKVIAENKQNREESALAHAASLELIKNLKGFHAGCLAVIAHVALQSHWKMGSDERVAKVAATLGIKMTKRFSTEAPDLSKLGALDVMRLAAAVLVDWEGECCVAGAYPISEELETILGEKSTAALKDKAKKQLAAAAAAKAAKKGGK